ncbi:hypothetical protein [Aeromonas enteropelogenes]|uniref:hypothetical protein n=1 Tax=Aeromonas enteropelogenes TaxID=29489 RepID=UPI00162571E9|nr:hypothetical protein [Aeromonas enteropelogenes]
MMVDLKVMAYFKTSLSTRNWDSAFFMAVTALIGTIRWLFGNFLPVCVTAMVANH